MLYYFVKINYNKIQLNTNNELINNQSMLQSVFKKKQKTKTYCRILLILSDKTPS